MTYASKLSLQAWSAKHGFGVQIGACSWLFKLSVLRFILILIRLPGFIGLSMAKIGTSFWTLLAYHLFSEWHHTRHRRWPRAMYGFWPCCQMNVCPRLTCRPIHKAMGQLSRIWIWKSLCSLVYTRNVSVESCGPKNSKEYFSKFWIDGWTIEAAVVSPIWS